MLCKDVNFTIMQKFLCHCRVFALFYFEFESNFQVLGRAIYRRVSCEFGGLTFQGAYFWNFMLFTSCNKVSRHSA